MIMNNKKNNTPSWLKEVTNTDKELKAEPFKPVKQENTDLVDFNGFLVNGTTRSAKKIEYSQVLLRLDNNLKIEIDKCQGSKNSIINALLEYAIKDLKEKGKSLIIKE